MKLKELNPDTDITEVKIKLTPELFEKYKENSERFNEFNKDEVYLYGPLMGDFLIGHSNPKEKNRKAYILPNGVAPNDFLECEIVE